MTEDQNQESKSKRGFASMNPQRQREIASLGGKTAHSQGVAHKWDSQRAKEAGRKGGQVSGKKRSTGRDTGEMTQ